MAADGEEVFRLLERLHSGPRIDTSWEWKKLGKEAEGMIQTLQKEMWNLSKALADERSVTRNLKAELQALGARSRSREGRSRTRASPGRSSLRSPSGATAHPSPATERRGSDPSRHVHFADTTPSPEPSRSHERTRRQYHLSSEELRGRNRSEAEARATARQKREYCAERDRLADRFNRHTRGPPNVVRIPEAAPRMHIPGWPRPPSSSPPHPPHPPPPMHPGVPPPPHMFDFPPPPLDPLAFGAAAEIPRRPGGMTNMMEDFLMHGGNDRPWAHYR